MKRRFCDSASPYWLVSLQRASPPGRPSVQLPRLFGSVDHLFFLLRRRPAHAHARQTCLLCSSKEEKRRCAHLRVSGRAWFLRSGSVLKGRSQLLILRCTEKAPCAEVRDRLRNRNDRVFHPQTLHRDFICHVLPLSGVCRASESGGKSESVGCYPCHSLSQHHDALDRPLTKIPVEIFTSCFSKFRGCASHLIITDATCLHAVHCLQCSAGPPS